MGIYPSTTVAFKWAQRFGTFSQVGGQFTEVRAGKLRILNFPAIDFNIDTPNWFQPVANEPISHPTWRLYFHSLTWLGDFLRQANGNSESPEAETIKEYSRQLTESWLEASSSGSFPKEAWDPHGVAMRSAFLILLFQLYPEDWLRKALKDHAERLSEEFSGFWNHGLIESISLYAIGAELACPEMQDLGRDRIRACVDVMIDDEGATNEQAPTYSGYIWRLMNRAIVCSQSYDDESLTAILEAKSLALETFMLHSLQPNKRFVEIGDSYPSLPGDHPGSVVNWFVRPARGGRPPAARKRTFSRGYIFGRASWELEGPIQNNTHFSFRFGPGREIHGHNDHLGLTFWSHGKGIITDSGHLGFEKSKWRDFVQSPPAHSVPIIGNKRFDHSKPTTLVFAHLDRPKNTSHFKAMDHAFENSTRSREVVVFDSGPMIVLDSSMGDGGESVTMNQLWHLAPEFEVDEVSGNRVEVLSIDGTVRASVVHFVVSGESAGKSCKTRIWRGSEDPIQGWKSAGSRGRVPRNTLSLATKGSRNSLLTVVIPRDAETGYDITTDSSEDAEAIFRIVVGGNTYSVVLDETSDDRQARLSLA